MSAGGNRQEAFLRPFQESSGHWALDPFWPLVVLANHTYFTFRCNFLSMRCLYPRIMGPLKAGVVTYVSPHLQFPSCPLLASMFSTIVNT